MPSTKQIVTEIQQECHGWNRDGSRGILPRLNEIVRFMVNHDSHVNLVIDGDTGMPPLFETEDGTKRYTMGDDCRKIVGLLYDPSLLDVSRATSSNDYSRYRQYQRFGEIRGFYWWNGIKFKMERFTSTPRIRSTNATVTFVDNPGDTDEKYYSLYYRQYSDISSESVQIPIVEEYHDIVIDGVIKRVRAISYGKKDDWLDWRENIVPNQYWMVANEQPVRNNQIPLRWC